MLAERIAGAELIESPNEGHMLIIPRAKEITGVGCTGRGSCYCRAMTKSSSNIW